MSIRNILVPIFDGVAFDSQLDAALQLVRSEPAHISAVFVRPDAAVIAASMPEMMIAAGITIEHLERAGSAAEASNKERFERWRTANHIQVGSQDSPVCTASWRERVAPVETVMIESGRLADLIVLPFPGGYNSATERAFSAAVFDSGRPALLVPDEAPKDLLSHILVAWNSSLEATRAVSGAMPILRQAAHVSIFTAPSLMEGALRDIYLGEQLAWHGIRARYLTPVTDTLSVGAALLDAAQIERASMIVMGAYSHSRVREMLLGGATRHVLHNAKIPILMAH